MQNKLPVPNIVITDTVAFLNTEKSEIKIDTLTIKSKPFVLNNLVCNWKHFFIIYDDYGLDIEAKLYDYKTKKIILEYYESPKFPEYYYDYKSATYFDSINKKHFDDFGQIKSQKDHHRVFCPANPVSGLLWDRYVKTQRIYCFPCYC